MSTQRLIPLKRERGHDISGTSQATSDKRRLRANAQQLIIIYLAFAMRASAPLAAWTAHFAPRFRFGLRERNCSVLLKCEKTLTSQTDL